MHETSGWSAWQSERNNFLHQIRTLEQEQRRLLDLCETLQNKATENYKEHVNAIEAYTLQLESENSHLVNKLAEVRLQVYDLNSTLIL